MKMDSSLSKSSSVNTSGASSNRSSGVGTATAPSSLGFREAAHFANIMVEFEDREASYKNRHSVKFLQCHWDHLNSISNTIRKPW